MPAYSGAALSTTVTKLAPKMTYRFRLTALNVQGKSAVSETVAFTTTPGAPSKPVAPRVVGRPTATALELAWGPGEANEGEADESELEYVVELDQGHRDDAKVMRGWWRKERVPCAAALVCGM